MSGRRLSLVLALVIAVIATLVVLLSPREDTDGRLTIARPGANNARLFAEVAGAFGFPVRTTTTRFTARGDTTAIHVVFAGPVEPTARELGAMLETVRRGAGLLVVESERESGSLLDSLNLVQDAPGVMIAPRPAPACTKAQNRRGVRDWPDGRPTLLAVNVPVDSAFRRTSPLPTGATSFVDVTLKRWVPDDSAGLLDVPDARTDTASAMLGFPYGRGRIVIATDGDVVRTDVLRVCEWGLSVAAIRALEYLGRGRRAPLLVAEAYQGEATRRRALAVVREALTDTRPGRATLALAGAGLILLAAAGRRTLAPLPMARTERRSPLEHVDALATAWARVRGTRTVARELAAGVRRRHGTMRHAHMDDATFVRTLGARYPQVRDDAERLATAITQPVDPDDLPVLRRAAARLDEACLTP
ncbi:MAG: hypothetical protein MUF21_06835 [Gemmatimonadaceae bacterium]|nr:hypothetical protein [Gemmatimonadaceae bacterium]